MSTPSPSAVVTCVGPGSGLRRKECFLECMCTVDTFSGSFWRTRGRGTRGRFYSKNLRGVLTATVALCAARRVPCGSIRGETARDRKFGRPRTGLARARRGVTRAGAGKRPCKLIHYFRYILSSVSKITFTITCYFVSYGFHCYR